MNFVSYTFLFFFLPTLFVLYYCSRGSVRALILLVASYIFYAWWRLDFLLLLLFITLLDYVCSKKISIAENNTRRRYWLIFSITSNLVVLSYFKYFNFGIESLNYILHQFGFSDLRWTKILLPIGISFYTFESMSYTIDVYRRHIGPAKNFLHYASFIALFPHLIAGPIIRFDSIGPQILHRVHTFGKFSKGVLLFIIGFSKKTLIADHLAPVAEAVFDGGGQGATVAWFGVFAYTIQLYFDFSGYSDMAIGLAAMFGFDFPKNFDSPYHAKSITEFWRRWHISLSTWLRDYLYIPLGGNKLGERRTYLNLFLTMLLGGLWHGASWMFLLWGGYHGTLLALERWRGKSSLLPIQAGGLQKAFTFFLIMVGWALFRSNDLSIIKSLMGFNGLGDMQSLSWIFRPFTIASLLVSPFLIWKAPQSWDLAQQPTKLKNFVFASIFVLAVIKMIFASYSPFLYYQF